MPRYDYECNSCADIFEVKQGFDDEPVAECPKCKSTARRIFTPVPIIFKGSGFYVTDHKNSSTPSTSKPGQERESANSETDKAEPAQTEAPKAESEKKDSKADASVS
jgi:putative FmdB family regulatory protein